MDKSLHPQFSAADADVVLQSLDDVYYRLPSFLLRNASRMFQRLLSNESSTPIAIPSYSRILTPVLQILSGLAGDPCSPFHFPVLADLEEAVTLLMAWDAPGPLNILQGSITSYMTLYDVIASHNLIRSPSEIPAQMDKTSIALRLYGLATRMGWENEAKMMSRYTLGVDIWQDQYSHAMQSVDSRGIIALMKLRRDRRDRFVRLFDSDWRRLEGDGKTGAEHECRICSERLTSGAPVLELKHRMFWEMDRFPSGDTLISALETDMGDWPESREAWNIKCTECGNPSVDRAGLIRDVKRILKELS